MGVYPDIYMNEYSNILFINISRGFGVFSMLSNLKFRVAEKMYLKSVTNAMYLFLA